MDHSDELPRKRRTPVHLVDRQQRSRPGRVVHRDRMSLRVLACELRERAVLPKMRALIRTLKYKGKPTTEETEDDDCLAQWKAVDRTGRELAIVLTISPRGEVLAASSKAIADHEVLHAADTTFLLSEVDRKQLSAWAEAELAACAERLGVRRPAKK